MPDRNSLNRESTSVSCVTQYQMEPAVVTGIGMFRHELSVVSPVHDQNAEIGLINSC